jgi:hypothetical protein
MKRTGIALLMAAMAAVAAWSQPKVAVLDAIIPQNMDPSVIIPTTEKIIERLVVSGRFTVLDRSNIESVLKEREFQVSGMVSDQDVVTAGKYLGADFVVVAKVQKVSETYFISAKMIAIKTGVIANQTSAQGEGKLSTLIDLAGEVGDVLSGGAVMAQSAAGGSKDISKPEAPVKPRPARQPSRAGSSLVVKMQVSSEDWTMDGDYSSTNYSYNETLEYFGILGMFDTKYISAGIGIGTLLSGSWTDDDFMGIDYGGTYYGSGDITNKQLFLIGSVDFKYPIQLGTFALYPILGMEYDFNLTYTDENGNDLKAGLSDTGKTMLDRLYAKAGLGFEYAFSPSMALRIEAIYGYKFESENDKSWDTWAEGAPYYYSNYSNITSKIDVNAALVFKL